LYKRIGVKHRKFHAYRATFATNLARAGVPIEQTAKLLGHGDISVTARYYVHVSAEKQASAVERIASFTLLKQNN
ncbi:tyrosine-type recombinase/integrase, partial [Gallibacter intestinalis]